MKGTSQQDNSLKPFKVFLQEKTKERALKAIDRAEERDRLEDLEERLIEESKNLRRREREYKFKLEKKIKEFDEREREYEEKLERKVTEIERKLCDLEQKLRIQYRIEEESEGDLAISDWKAEALEEPEVETQRKSSLKKMDVTEGEEET